MPDMKAIVATEPGGPEKLAFVEVPRPVPGPGELLVRIHATALNRADLLQREGKYPPPPGESDIIGLEMAGEVAELGADANQFAVGDRVFGLLPGGGYAEYAVIPEGLAMPVPENLAMTEAAAVPETYLTAFQALHWIGRLSKGETVLIHAGASGVGTSAIQLAREAGARVLVTASAPKHDTCIALGAEVTIDYKSEDFAERVKQETNGRGADVIVDFIGASYFDRNIRSLAMDGRLVMLAMLGGAKADELNVARMFAKRATVVASTLRNRSLAYKQELTGDFVRRVLPLLTDGRVKPVIDDVLDWADVAEAHRRMGANETAGKLVLKVI